MDLPYMNLTTWIIAIAVALILLFIVARIIKSCLPKIIVGLVILAVLGYLAYWYFTK
jgi:hypothetical protein